MARATAFAEQLPSHRGDQHSAGDADHGDRDAEELENQRSEQGRSDQQPKAVQSDQHRQPRPLWRGAISGEAEEKRRRAKRIHHRKQPCKDQKEGV